MSNIEDLQSRITAAMERIGAGIETLAQRDTGGPDPGLAEALEEEKLANAQLKERLRALNQKHFDEMERLQSQIAAAGNLDQIREDMQIQGQAMSRLDGDVQRLRQANDQLRASNAVLREANEEGVGEPHLINKAMLAELEGLHAARAADAAEAAAILAKLEKSDIDEGERADTCDIWMLLKFHPMHGSHIISNAREQFTSECTLRTGLDTGAGII